MSDLEGRLKAALHDETAGLSARPDLADDMVAHGTKIRRRRRAVGGVAGLMVVAAILPLWKSIDTSSGPLPPSHTPTVSPPSTPTKSTTSTPPPALVWSTKTIDVAHDAPGAQVINLRVGRHATYDRAVIDLNGPIPSYHVGYVRQFRGSQGVAIPLPGNAALAIHLHFASIHDDNGHVVFLGQLTDTYALPELQGSTLSDFEGYVDLGLGLTRRAGFRVFTLPSPNRIVIDLHH